jgi:hypothetical protein
VAWRGMTWHDGAWRGMTGHDVAWRGMKKRLIIRILEK